jgi:hypothetical protein
MRHRGHSVGELTPRQLLLAYLFFLLPNAAQDLLGFLQRKYGTQQAKL